MGQPKATLPFPEAPLLATLIARLGRRFPNWRVVFAPATLTPALEKILSDCCPTERLIFDDRPGGGALAGIERAARHAAQRAAPRWLAIPCDMPFLTAEFLERLAAACPAAPAIAPCAADGRVTGVCAAYGPAIQPALSDFLDRGQRRVQDFLNLAGAARLPFPAYADLPGAARILFNLNTPDDYRQALRWLSDEGDPA